MTNFVDDIYIQNFKSINSLTISGCKRINLLIGRPNVGKSNILEALSLFSILLNESKTDYLSALVRVENEPELFHIGDYERKSFVRAGKYTCSLEYNPKNGLQIELSDDTFRYHADVDEKLKVKPSLPVVIEPSIRRYTYRQDGSYRKGHARYLFLH